MSYDVPSDFTFPPTFDGPWPELNIGSLATPATFFVPRDVPPVPIAVGRPDVQAASAYVMNMEAPEFDTSLLASTTTQAQPLATSLGKRKERDASSDAFFDTFSGERVKRAFTSDVGTAGSSGLPFDESAPQTAMMFGDAPAWSDRQVPGYDENVGAMLGGLDAPPQQFALANPSRFYNTQNNATPLAFGDQLLGPVPPENVYGQWHPAQPAPEPLAMDPAVEALFDRVLMKIDAMNQAQAARAFDTNAPLEDVADTAAIAPEQTLNALPTLLPSTETGLSSTSTIPLPFGPRRHASKPAEKSKSVSREIKKTKEQTQISLPVLLPLTIAGASSTSTLVLPSEPSRHGSKTAAESQSVSKMTDKTKGIIKKTVDPRRSARLGKAAAAPAKATVAATSDLTAEASGSTTVAPALTEVAGPSTAVCPVLAKNAKGTQRKNTRNGKRDWYCCIDDCNYVSHDCPKDRNRHMVTHFIAFNAQYIKCPYCNKGFARLDSRERHLTEAKKSKCVADAIEEGLDIKKLDQETYVPGIWEFEKNIQRARRPAKYDPLFQELNAERVNFGLPAWE